MAVDVRQMILDGRLEIVSGNLVIVDGKRYRGIAIGYARVSTMKQEGNVSLEAQEEDIRTLCESEGLYLLYVVKEVWSGTKIVRDKLDKEIMPLVNRGEVTHVVCYDQDRWARNEYARLKWEHEVLEPKNVELLIVGEGKFASRHDRDFVRGIKGNVAEYQAKQTAQKVVQALNFKANNREFCGGNIPYGYTTTIIGHRTNNQGRSKPIRRLDPHPEEGKIVTFVKELYGWGRSDLFPLPERFQGLGNYGTTIITQVLNELSLKKRNGEPFDTPFVKKLIRDRENYHLGTMTYRKTYGDKDERRRRGTSHRPKNQVIEIPDAFAPIVPLDLQLLCQKKIEENAKHVSRFTVQHSEYVGSGLYTCAVCGGILIGRTRSPDAKHKVAEQRYMCAKRYNKAGCSAPMIKADYLHDGLDEIVRLFLGNPQNLEKIVESSVEMVKAQQAQRPESLDVVKAKCDKISRQKRNLIANLKEAPELGAMLRDDLLQLDMEQRSLEATLKKLMAAQHETSSETIQSKVRRACGDILTLWDNSPIGRKNEILKALVSSAKVDTREKEVVYSLAIGLERLLGEQVTHPGEVGQGGCVQVMAEAHGNRTHLGSFSPPTPVLKTGPPTSDGCASSFCLRSFNS
jgi:DNA invertase Pin-like site-specific DNA recombinase